MNIIEEWIQSYDPQSSADLFNAKREVIQEVVLSGLYRAGFFEKACFYGGTALRVFYGLDRFSEDLDFSLLQPLPSFSLSDYFDDILREFELLELNASITLKQKNGNSAIESAFLKDNTNWSMLEITDIGDTGISKALKVKIEIDKDPPLKFQTASKLLLRPFSNYINCMTVENLFAGKMHALLFRKWVQNEKGRDWYDFVWYVSRKAKINLEHFNERAWNSGSIPKETYLDLEALKTKLHERIESMNLDLAIRDISRFIKDQRSIDLWSKPFFHDVVELM